MQPSALLKNYGMEMVQEFQILSLKVNTLFAVSISMEVQEVPIVGLVKPSNYSTYLLTSNFGNF